MSEQRVLGRSIRFRRFLTGSLVGLLAATSLQAATVRWVGFPELVDRSALIFEGAIVGESSRMAHDGRDVVTDVEFRVTRVLKGVDPGQRLVLSFSGGRIGDLSIVVHGSRRPAVGETGVYFIEDPSRPQGHPFYGWSQGHFLTREDTGTGVVHVFAFDGRPVAGIRDVPSPHMPVAAENVAAGVELMSDTDAREPMTLDAFRAHLATLLEGQR